MEQGFELKEKVAQLQSMLMGQHPQMPTLLREIHLALKKQPENVTLLSEEDIHTIFQGLEKQTGTFLAESVAKNAKKPSSVAALKAKGLDAF